MSLPVTPSGANISANPGWLGHISWHSGIFMIWNKHWHALRSLISSTSGVSIYWYLKLFTHTLPPVPTYTTLDDVNSNVHYRILKKNKVTWSNCTHIPSHGGFLHKLMMYGCVHQVYVWVTSSSVYKVKMGCVTCTHFWPFDCLCHRFFVHQLGRLDRGSCS